jgi:endogenous inhibitor of DNA gyrase (YacG/DUF329 family)
MRCTWRACWRWRSTDERSAADWQIVPGSRKIVFMNQPHKRRRAARCPQCGKTADLAPDNRFRPFCSERCKLIDLGAWAAESYRVPIVEDRTDPDDDTENERS